MNTRTYVKLRDDTVNTKSRMRYQISNIIFIITILTNTALKGIPQPLPNKASLPDPLLTYFSAAFFLAPGKLQRKSRSERRMSAAGGAAGGFCRGAWRRFCRGAG